MYRAIHNEWAFNDDLKLFEYDDLKVNIGQLYFISLKGYIWKKQVISAVQKHP